MKREITKRLAQVVFLCVIALTTLGADSVPQRFEKLGHHLMCSCGCNQVLLECNHVGCPLSDGMRNELSAAIKNNAADDSVMQVFVQKYGPIVLAAPTMKGFDRAAWITPYAVFAFGIALVALIVRSWKKRRPTAATPAPMDDPVLSDFRRRAREETQL